MNDKREKTVCFTGHRNVIHKGLTQKLDEIVEILINDGFLYFGTGGARGFDKLAAECILRAKEKYPDIKLIIVLPSKDSWDKWNKYDRDEYMCLAKKADKVISLCDHYYTGCMHVRNKHLVDGSSVCVSYRYSSGGGTAFTENYARKQGLTIVSVI